MKSFLPYVFLFCHLRGETLTLGTGILVGGGYSISEKGEETGGKMGSLGT